MKRLDRAVDWFSSTRAFAVVGPKVVPRLDRFLYRVTGGRFMSAQGRTTVLLLTTTGRRSGEPRPTPLACLADDDGTFVVVGSNYGREDDPQWTANLLADPRATVGFRGATTTVSATLLDDDDRAAMWSRLVAGMPNFDDYEQRSGRELRVFRLVPTTI